MDQFWETFHEVWGEDSNTKHLPNSKYDKRAWMYVQTKLLEHFNKKNEKKATK